eukprot:jgi/Bigna1/74036/fgenesh1_pg.27_\
MASSLSLVNPLLLLSLASPALEAYQVHDRRTIHSSSSLSTPPFSALESRAESNDSGRKLTGNSSSSPLYHPERHHANRQRAKLLNEDSYNLGVRKMAYTHTTASGLASKENPFNWASTFPLDAYTPKRTLIKDIALCSYLGRGFSGSVSLIAPISGPRKVAVDGSWNFLGWVKKTVYDITNQRFALKMQRYKSNPAAEASWNEIAEPFREGIVQAHITRDLVDTGISPNFVRMLDLFRLKAGNSDVTVSNHEDCKGDIDVSSTLCKANEKCHYILMEAAAGSFENSNCKGSTKYVLDNEVEPSKDNQQAYEEWQKLRSETIAKCKYFNHYGDTDVPPKYFVEIMFQYMFAWLSGMKTLNWKHMDADRKNTFRKLNWHAAGKARQKTHWCYWVKQQSYCFPFAADENDGIPLVLLADYGKTNVNPAKDDIASTQRSASYLEIYLVKFFVGGTGGKANMKKMFDPLDGSVNAVSNAVNTFLDDLTKFKTNSLQETSMDSILANGFNLIDRHFGPGKVSDPENGSPIFRTFGHPKVPTSIVRAPADRSKAFHFGYPSNAAGVSLTLPHEYNSYMKAGAEAALLKEM